MPSRVLVISHPGSGNNHRPSSAAVGLSSSGHTLEDPIRGLICTSSKQVHLLQREHGGRVEEQSCLADTGLGVLLLGLSCPSCSFTLTEAYFYRRHVMSHWLELIANAFLVFIFSVIFVLLLDLGP